MQGSGASVQNQGVRGGNRLSLGAEEVADRKSFNGPLDVGLCFDLDSSTVGIMPPPSPLAELLALYTTAGGPACNAAPQGNSGMSRRGWESPLAGHICGFRACSLLPRRASATQATGQLQAHGEAVAAFPPAWRELAASTLPNADQPLPQHPHSGTREGGRGGGKERAYLVASWWGWPGQLVVLH